MIKEDHLFKKNFGQNFITNQTTVNKIVDLLELASDDKVIEIGPGDGRFTERIIDKVKELTLVEIDTTLIPFLEDKFSSKNNLKIINQDILDFEPLSGQYKIYGSLPYNISKKIISKFLEVENAPELMVFIVQKEVGEDYVAQPPKASFLSIYSQIWSEIKYSFKIDRHYFYPIPKVDGGVLVIRPLKNRDLTKGRELSKFIKNGYQTPRKQLKNILKSIYRDIDWDKAFEATGLGPMVRPAELNLENWKNLFRNLN